MDKTSVGILIICTYLLFLDNTRKVISVRHISGEIIATWKLQTLTNRFMQKMPTLLFVSAFTEERDGLEYF
ncbi:hypothetical protein KKE26_09675, partial [bacterium]|nr:hypothetical protein [bacterium]MBU1752293.1 hypothetical protein [bacterium]